GEDAKKGWTTEADLLDGIRTDEDALQSLMQTPGAVMLTARDTENTIAGCVYLERQAGSFYLGMLTVSPLLQAGGIGKQLLYAAEDYVRQQGYNSITMSVISVRHELIAWYQRHGYAATGDTKPFPSSPAFGIPKQPLEFIVMKKTL
ncbi:MAG TPA: GNAT family N-acetyltransferase, partial [Chitinophagaceae bacterium]|nr:GNAT family N-acetyltransferase [Chitinophagaceae bacterium]